MFGSLSAYCVMLMATALTRCDHRQFFVCPGHIFDKLWYSFRQIAREAAWFVCFQQTPCQMFRMLKKATMPGIIGNCPFSLRALSRSGKTAKFHEKTLPKATGKQAVSVRVIVPEIVRRAAPAPESCRISGLTTCRP